MPEPALSVVLAALAGTDVLETTLLHLRRQSVADRIELLVVTADPLRLDELPVELPELRDVRIVRTPGAKSVAQANAAGVREARAPVVAFAEDHAFPDPGWAAALLRAHGETVAAVGPVVSNANPATIASWVDFVMGYGRWMEPCQGGEAPFLPGHNSSYRRDVLLAQGDHLAHDLESETVFHLRLAAEGARLVVAPEARLAHVNFSRWSSKLPACYHSGRVFASARRAPWSRPRRLVMAVASPAIPVVRFVRALGMVMQPGRRKLVPWRIVPGLALGLAVDGAGQMVGHMKGPGGSVERLARFEFRRVDHVTNADRAMLARLTHELRET